MNDSVVSACKFYTILLSNFITIVDEIFHFDRIIKKKISEMTSLKKKSKEEKAIY